MVNKQALSSGHVFIFSQEIGMKSKFNLFAILHIIRTPMLVSKSVLSLLQATTVPFLT
jgi:hypothetical protein